MPSAFNEDTGELLVLDTSGKWSKPTMAENPQSKERLYLDGSEWKPVPLQRAERNAGRAAAVLQGPAMGFGDEFVAGLENPGESIQYLSRFARPGALAATLAGEKGPDVPMPGYEKSLEKFRGIESRYRQDSPVESFALTAAGGLAGGGFQAGRAAAGAVASALPNAGRITQAAVTGAGFGSVAGFGSGEGGAANRLVSSIFGAGVGAWLGASVEAASPAISRFITWARGNPAMLDPNTGTLNQAGQRAAQEAGFDPAQASQQMQREFGELARDAVRPQDAARAAEARSLPVPIQTRTGQNTLDPYQQMFESDAGKGLYGDAARVRMQGSSQAQQEGLRANIGAIQGQIGGGRQVQELGQGAVAAQGRLAQMEAASRQNYRGLYNAAQSARDQASIPGQHVSQGVFEIGQELNQAGFTRRSAGAVHEIIDELQGLAARTQARPVTNIGEIFARRQELNALAQGAPTPQTVAAGTARRSLDRWLQNAIDSDLIEGNPQVVDLWRAANQARRGHAQMYQAGDLVEKLVERIPGQADTLKLDPNGAANLIFGRSATGWTTKTGMARDLERVRATLGEASPAWRALKEESWLRLARAGEGPSTPTGREFSGANFMKAFEDAMAKSPEVMRTLYSPAELRTIAQFGRVARLLTTSVEGGKNFSNTGASVNQAVQRLFMSSFMGPKMAAFLDGVPFIKGLSNIGQELRTQSAILGRLQTGAQAQPMQGITNSIGSLAGAGANQRPAERR